MENWFTDLFKDGSWLKNAFSGENFGKSLTGLAGIGGAVTSYNYAKAQEKYQDNLFGLQKDQYNNSLLTQEEEKKRRDQVDNSFASVWG